MKTPIQRIGLYLLIALLPLLVTMILLFLLRSATIFDKQLFYSDEVYYWMQTAAMRVAGFNSGYFTANEVPAPLAGSHFYTWGVAVPAFYTVISMMTGWQPFTMVLVNLLIVAIAIVIALQIMQPSPSKLLFFAILFATFPPLILYAITSMTELANHALAILLAAGFYRILQDRQAHPAYRYGILLLILLASLFRLTWLILLPALFLYWQPQPVTGWRLCRSILLSLPLMLAFAAIYTLWGAPYPNSLTEISSAISRGIGEGLLLWRDLIQLNLSELLLGNPAEILLRIFVVMGILLAAWGIYHKSAWVHLFNLLGILVFALFVYQVGIWRDFRLFAPHMLFSLVLFLATQDRWLAKASVLVMITAFVGVIPQYLYLSQQMYQAEYRYSPLQDEYTTVFAEAGVIYRPDSLNAWCNTVLHTFHYSFTPELLLAFDHGLGLSIVVTDAGLQNPRSQYLLLRDDEFMRLGDTLQLELLVAVPDGGLYRNRIANCDDSGT